MSTELQALPNAIGNSVTLRELTELLIKHNDLHDGLYQIVIEYAIGLGTAGPTPETVAPTAMVGLSRVGLAKAEVEGPTTVDAALVNPRKMRRKKN
jgi:hypothetical protein